MRREIDFVEPTGLELKDYVVKINRSAKVMKGGRRFGFSALVVLGDGRGVVGLGYGKAREVPPAVEKAVADARKRLVRVPLVGTTLPHPVTSSHRSSTVKMLPAAPGTGLIAGHAVRAVLEAVGVRDALSKALGSRNAGNIAKAAFEGLLSLRTRSQIASRRGVALAAPKRETAAAEAPGSGKEGA